MLDSPLEGVVDVETLGIWLEARPRSPFEVEVAMRDVGSMMEYYTISISSASVVSRGKQSF